MKANGISMPDGRLVTLQNKKGDEITVSLIPLVAICRVEDGQQGMKMTEAVDMPSAWKWLADQGFSKVLLDKHLDVG